MGAGIFDSRIFGGGFGTEEMRKVFDDIKVLKNWILIEIALAKCQGEIGIIPKEIAQDIQKITFEKMDIDMMLEKKKTSTHAIVALVKTMQSACNKGSGEYIHWGATTQDIYDTGLVLQIREALKIIERDLFTFKSLLKGLAKKHRFTLMAGRTHGQHAVPITFGYKVAVWIDELERHFCRFEQCKSKVLQLQFSGAAGTLSTIKPELAFKLQDLLANELNLICPRITWHTARDNFVEVVNVLSMIAGTIGKIANEILTLQRTEIDELEEPWKLGEIASSTMPHKRNPTKCENILLLYKMVKCLVPLMYESLIMQHEREWYSRGFEQKAISEAFLFLSAMLRDIIYIIDGIYVNDKKMEKNLNITKGLIMSERLMIELGRKIGKQTAHEVIYLASQEAFKENKPFIEILSKNPVIMKNMSKEELMKLFEPSDYLGLAPAYVNRIVENIE